MKTIRSKTLMERLSEKLDQSDEILESFDNLLEIAKSNNRFNTPQEFKNYLAEGAILNVNKLSSKTLSIPCGEYMVWTMNNGNTALVPIGPKNKEVYEHTQQPYEVFTKDLLRSWNTMERLLGENEAPANFDEKESDADESKFKSSIQMSTVDRTPIALAMQQRGYTVTSLANACGVDPPAISRILREPKSTQGDPGGRNPSLPLAAKISHELKIDAESLFPDIFGTPSSDLKARQTPGNKGSGAGPKKGKATKMFTQGSGSD